MGDQRHDRKDPDVIKLPPELATHLSASELATNHLQNESMDLRQRPASPARQNEVKTAASDKPSNGIDGGLTGSLSNWGERHQNLVDKAKGSNPDYAFYGDSITEAMHLNNSFKSLFGGKAENFGIHSDTTDNLRYRLQNGEAQFAGGKSPKDVVMHIGTNDLDRTTKDSTQIANDIVADAALAHKKLPDSHILVVGIMPRPGYEAKIAEVNKLVADKIASQQDSKLRFADIGSSMPEGAPGIWQPGGLHPTYREGYTRMLGAIRQELDKNPGF